LTWPITEAVGSGHDQWERTVSAAGAAQEAYRELPETERTPARAEGGLELVARIAQYARRVGRSAFKGRVRVGIENAAVIAEGRNGK
jgi:hypothetical protein